MRKPLVVVCVTTSVVLLAGAVAATTAGAGTTPDDVATPAAVAAATGLPGVPELPVDPDEPAPDRPAVPPRDLPGPATQQPPAERPTGKPAAGNDQDTPKRPGGPAPTPAVDEPSDERPADERPATQKPTATQKPQKPAQDDARRDVAPGGAAASVQQQVLKLVNENRRRGGCDAMTLDGRLSTAANRHAADMARRGYFAHESPNGDGAGDRVEDAGYDWKRYGENIARGADSAHEVVDGWMNSPAHRDNIMDCRFLEMGLGLAFDDERTPYWVQDLATHQ